MEMPIDTSKLTIVVIGDVVPQLIYGTKELRKNSKGQSLYKIPVLISGTGERQDPTTTISVAGELPSLPKGSRLQPNGLTMSNWSMRGADGVQRYGVTLRAQSVSLYQAKGL